MVVAKERYEKEGSNMRITIMFLLTSHFSAGTTRILMLIYCCIYHLYIEAAILSMRLCNVYAIPPKPIALHIVL